MSFWDWLINRKTCLTCVELRRQIDYEREVNRQLVDTIKEIVTPKQPIVQQVEVNPEQLQRRGISWNKRRAELERNAAQAALVMRTSNHIAKPDMKVQSVEELEQELGINQEAENVNA